MDRAAAFRDELFRAGLLIPTGVDGLYGRSVAFETIVTSVSAMVGAAGTADSPAVVRFPPLLPRAVLERTDYLRSFPQLTGSIHTFVGDDRAHARLLAQLESDQDWTAALEPAPVVLCPSACHAIYPTCSGRLPAGGRRFDVVGYCFRHEPSVDPARMQAFRMHEHVLVGDPADAQRHRDGWLDRGLALLSGLGLPVEAVVGHDPFFGRVGKMLADNQEHEALKIEVVTPITSVTAPTAIMSANYHRDHFGVAFGIQTEGGHPAHSACVGFGLERIALALLHVHGLDSAQWPGPVRVRLGL